MNVTSSASSPLTTPTDLLVVGCDDDLLGQPGLIADLDRALGGALLRTATDERFKAKAGQTLSMHTFGKLPAARIALVGVGPRKNVGPGQMRAFAGRATRLANAAGARAVAVVAPPCELGNIEKAQALTEGLELGAYKFDKYFAEDKRVPRAATTALLLLGSESSDIAAAIRRARLTAAAVARTRDLINEPAAYMTPVRMAEIARQAADDNGKLTITVLDREACAAQGMGLFLAVSQGSVEEPRFIHVAWKPPGAKKRVVLIGKGVTFDSGGLSLKPNDGMLDMKTDMSGAAAVLSVMPVVAEEGLAVEVHALAACTENMPSGSSYKLGDVLRSKAGKTVEINNTDAEGRLTLADAIAYALELEPDAMFDFATLTGACVVALGPHIAGVMSNDDALASDWLAAAKASGEEMWRLPLPDRLMEQLKSDVADMKNTGERWGGALTAGLFLKEFAGDVPWVHVDIAGPASADKELGHVTKGGTGFAVTTMLEYLRRVSAG